MLDTHGSKHTKQPVAWGEFYGGKIVAVSLHKSHHYTVPLYTHPSEQTEVRPIDEWHEDYGDVVWWAHLEGEWIGEAAWIGTPNDSDWPGYHTHWSPHPPFPPPLKANGFAEPDPFEGVGETYADAYMREKARAESASALLSARIEECAVLKDQLAVKDVVLTKAVQEIERLKNLVGDPEGTTAHAEAFLARAERAETRVAELEKALDEIINSDRIERRVVQYDRIYFQEHDGPFAEIARRALEAQGGENG